MKSKGLQSEKDSSGYDDSRQEAYAIAKKVLAAQTPEQQRDILFALQNKDPTMYQTVMRMLNDMPNPGSEEQSGEANGQQSAGAQQQG